MSTVSVFRRFSTQYFGICQFFLRYYGIEYPPMSPSITSGKQRRPSFFLKSNKGLKLNPLSKFPPFSERLLSEKTKLDRNSHTLQAVRA